MAVIIRRSTPKLVGSDASYRLSTYELEALNALPASRSRRRLCQTSAGFAMSFRLKRRPDPAPTALTIARTIWLLHRPPATESLDANMRSSL
ncbi:hypothetical protein EVAR_84134_1 [Eumeta japonica]|uniref:Uncharacterized protein n=1 Tax=Eumeta variegata TaxID=151549 RepID=A0A4C1UYZ6_EUMVA|nr:hypothetical protein EVAR_84134_1 [Eumeta japonica]